MAAIALGKTREQLIDTPVQPASSIPIRPCSSMSQWRKGYDLCRTWPVHVITPFTLARAMSPVTIAGALTQQHAEAMAGIALCQIIRPGVPVMYGGFTSNVDMKSGAPPSARPNIRRRHRLPASLPGISACRSAPAM